MRAGHGGKLVQVGVPENSAVGGMSDHKIYSRIKGRR